MKRAYRAQATGRAGAGAVAIGEHALGGIAIVVGRAGAVCGTADATILLRRCEEGKARKKKERVEEHGGRERGNTGAR